MSRLVALSGLLLLLTGPVAATERVTWLAIDFPPFYILDGPDRGRGIGDEVTSLLMSRMPELEHEVVVASPSRITRELESGGEVCSTAYIKTAEREVVMLYSVPDLVLPPNGITVRVEELDRFGGPNAVSLADLLTRPELRAGVAEGRSYGPRLDHLLATSTGPQIERRAGTDIYAGLLEMLLRGRLDYVLGYPYEAVYVGRKRGVADRIATLRLTETGAGYTLAHVVCPKTPWGRAMIDRIDRILLEERPAPAYRELVERWLPPELIPEYREQFAAQFALP